MNTKIKVNAREIPIDGVPVHTTVLDWLRDRGLTGAKEGCAEGECGACSVLVARPGIDSPTEWTAVNACLLPVASLDGQEVITSEGLGIARCPAPGAAGDGRPRRLAVRLLYSGLRVQHGRGVLPPRPYCARRRPCDHEHGPNGFDLHALSGNLCRCTGYRPIRDAAYALGGPEADDVLAARQSSPPPAPAATRLAVAGAEFLRPETLGEVLDVLAEQAERADRGRVDRLRGRGEPARRPGAAGRCGGSAGRAA